MKYSLKILLIVLIIPFVLFILIQFIPYGRDHSNPAVTAEPPWDKPQTRELFFRACADCHSNQTFWPWYSNIAPVSWQIQHDVNAARRKFNVSEWGRSRNAGKAAADEVKEGGMPPASYQWMHPAAKLTEAKKNQFTIGLVATFGKREK